ncbi:MAG: lipocalin family protein [Methylococcales bacterium]
MLRRIIAGGALVILGLGFYFMSEPKQNQAPGRNPLFLLAPEDNHFAAPGSEPLVFPNDHGIHRQSGSELWQIGGYLEMIGGERFGLEITLIRVDLGADPGQRQSAWATDQIFHLNYGIIPFNHGEIYRDRETSRNAMGLAGYDPRQHEIRVYKRELKFHESNEGSDMELNIPDGAYPVNLEFHPAKPMLIAPFSEPFRYYTISRMAARGTLTISGESHAVSGEAFFEHSWGKLPVGRGQLVRDRLMLQLSNGIDLNLLQSHRRDGTGKAVNSGFMVLPQGKRLAFEQGDLDIEQSGYWTSSTTGIRYPVEWRIQIPEQAMVLDVRPWMDNQETTDSPINWAGMVSVSGHSGANPVEGFGQVQLSGY